MIVEVANTPLKYKECLKFLEGFEYKTLLYTVLFFVKNESDKIVCVAGYHKDYGSMIEPMYSKSNKASLLMYEFMIEYLKSLGHLIVRFKTKNEKLIKIMKTKFQFVECDKQNYLVKEL